jgi:hypothetical protein
VPEVKPRIAYLDASLRDHMGHQANACRLIGGELRARGFELDVFASRQIGPELAATLGARPWFRLRPYEQSMAFRRIDACIQGLSFGQDLRSAWATGRHPFLYFNSVLAPQFSAIGQWLASFPQGESPHAAIEFGAPSGASTEGWFGQFAAAYRDSGRQFRVLAPDRVLLFTFDAAASAEYARLLELPVAALPAVHEASSVRRLRRPGDLTIGFLGQQRAEKGGHLIPGIVKGLRAAGCSTRILIHDADPAERAMTRSFRALAEGDPRVEFLQRPADPAAWQELLGRTDLLALPYEPNRYKASYSAVAVEAVSAAIPMVVPAATTMEALAIEYQGQATAFGAWNANAVCGAILRAIASFEKLSAQASAGAAAWEKRNGAARFVDRLLEFAATPASRFADAAPVSGLERGALDALLVARGWSRKIVHLVLGADRYAP